MLGFLFRKTFYDSWDNLYKIALINIGFIVLAAILTLTTRLSTLETLTTILTAVRIFACSIYLAAAAHVLKRISDYGSFGFADFFNAFKVAWPAGVAMGFFILVLFLIITIVIPFYLAMGSFVGLMLGALVFWVAVFALLSFQFFFVVCARLGTDLRKAFKKCMLIFFDNSGFSLYSLLHSIAALLFSVIFVFLFPGPAGILLFLDQGLRLRLLKYDWLEENPNANRKKIPWDVLLIEEREKTGTRSLRSLIFPWKD